MARPGDLPRPSAAVLDTRGGMAQEWRDFFLDLASQQSNDSLRALYLALADRVTALEDASGQTFVINGSLSVQVTGSPASGAVNLNLIGDVNTPGISYYYGTDSAGKKGWFQLTLDALSNVVAPTPATGDALVWDGTNWVPGRVSSLPYPYLTDQAGNRLTDQAGNYLIANTPQIPFAWLVGAQALDSDLTVIGGLTGTGYLRRTGPDAWQLDALPQLQPYTLATLPTVTPAWRIIAVTDLTGGQEPCFSDGTNWRRFSDRSIAS